MKKKVLCALLAMAMAFSPVGAMSVAAAEFTDGAAGEAMVDAVDEEMVFEEFEVSEAEVFSDEAGIVVEEAGTESVAMGAEVSPRAADYQISVTGHLVLSETEEFVRLINEERRKLGAQPLVIDQDAMDVAMRRAMEIMVYYDHKSPSGIYSQGRFSEVLTQNCELNAKGFKDNWKNTDYWEKPVSHWDILMDPNYTSIGFAIAFQKETINMWGQYQAYGVANLGSGVSETYTGGYNDKVESNTIGISKENLSNGLNKGETAGDNNSNCKVFIGEKTMLKPSSGDSSSLSLYYLDGTLGIWESSNPAVATVDSTGTVTGIAPGTADIRFYVNGDRNMYYSRTVIVKEPKPEVVPAPKAPSVKGTPSNYQYVKLSWKKPTNAKGYLIYQYNSKTKKYERMKYITSGDTLSYIIKQGYGKTGYYKVRPYNLKKDGSKVYGSSSKAVKVKTAPYTPSISSLSTKYRNTIIINWKKASSAEGYQIYRATSKNGKYTRVKTISDDKITSYKNTGLTKGKGYYYKIRAYRVNTDGSRVYGKFSEPKGIHCR